MSVLIYHRVGGGTPDERDLTTDAVEKTLRELETAEELARAPARRLFKAEWVNVQPHSGATANEAAYFAVLDFGHSRTKIQHGRGLLAPGAGSGVGAVVGGEP